MQRAIKAFKDAQSNYSGSSTHAQVFLDALRPLTSSAKRSSELPKDVAQ
ncbi:hypothetical protein KIPB_013901, partial [Kipferlia bialata]|eukprot:g13901.t1